MIRLAILGASITLYLAQPPAPVTPYNPDNLGPGEVACGRLNSKKSPPCHCVKHRNAKRAAETAKCQLIDDRRARAECFINIPHCPPVVDSEHFEWDSSGVQMPAECKRTCSKARCECCKS